MDIATSAAVVGTGVAVLGGLYAVTRSSLRASRRMDQFREDWEGQPGRKGFDPVPGVPERLQQVEQVTQELRDLVREAVKQLQPNGGSSARDAINRVELDVKRLAMDGAMQARLLAHHVEQASPMYAELLALRAQMNEILRAQGKDNQPAPPQPLEGPPSV